MNTLDTWKYIAVRKGRIVTGTSREIEAAIGISHGYCAKLAASGLTTRSGWRVFYDDPEIDCQARKTEYTILIAEKRGEDPIIGDSGEIADLTGIPEASIRAARQKRRPGCGGWKIREATSQEIEEAERKWA